MKKQNLTLEAGQVVRSGIFTAQLVQINDLALLKISKSNAKSGIFLRSKQELQQLDSLIKLLQFLKTVKVSLPDVSLSSGNEIYID